MTRTTTLRARRALRLYRLPALTLLAVLTFAYIIGRHMP